MDIKKYLIEQIRACKRKMNIAKLIDMGIVFAAAGGILGILCELVSLIWQFYYVHLAAGQCFAAGFLAGIGYAVYKRADMGQAARRLDSFGLKERMITAYEQIDKESELAQMQRQDAMSHYRQAQDRIKISLLPDKRHILALIVSAAVVIGMGFIPSPVRNQAMLHHQVQEQVKEEKKELEELLDALEGVDMDSLTEEQKKQLEELTDSLKLSQEELSMASTWESFAAAMEKLDYKYEQAGMSLESIAGQMTNPEMAGIASAEAIAKAAANQSGQQTASAGTPSGSNGSGDGDGDDSSDGNSGDGDGNGNGSGDRNGNGSGNGDGNGNGDGSGSGSGNGNGNGNGTGNGNSGGSGSGIGNGRGTGSSSAEHDYVSIPNGIGNDSALTGNKNGDQDSDYFRQQNSLAWEGQHVDYNSVIGEYTDNAYEGIANGSYPSGMESVIRDYFESLSK